MKIKYVLLGLIFLLIAVAISQIFNLPPLNREVFPVYKSGYFKELDRELDIITDSFLAIKTMSKPVYAWVYLDDIQKKHNFVVRVYDNRGFLVKAPGMKSPEPHEEVQKILGSLKADPVYSVSKGTYSIMTPMKAQKTCLFCHRIQNKNRTLGAIVMIRDYDGHIYYSGERIIIFSIITLVLLLLLFLVIRWEPGRNIKELFDKT